MVRRLLKCDAYLRSRGNMVFIYILWLQYVGSKTGKFNFHWNYYKKNDRKAQRDKEHLQQELFERAAIIIVS